MNNQYTSSNGNGGSIKEIEREIDQDRSHLMATLDALENKFSPGQMVDQALNYLRRNGGEFSDNLIKTVTQNPIPTLLTGVGLAWMAVSSGRTDRHSHDRLYDQNQTQLRDNGFYDRPYQPGMSFEEEFVDDPSSSGKLNHLKESTSHLKDNVKQSAHRATDKAKHMAEDVRHSAHALRAKSQQQWSRSAQSAREFFAENPLAVGALAIAVGAVMGALLPMTAVEKEMVGSTGKESGTSTY